jgi:tetratricopeptide (TPR) repeat protein
MKSHFILIVILTFFIFLLHFGAVSQRINESCPISRNIGTENICLPNLSGMTECILKANVMDYVNGRSMNGNKNIAFYIDNANVNSTFNLEFENIENHLVVFTTMELENEKINNDFILLLASKITSNYKKFIEENWGNIKKEMSLKNANIKIDQPVLIENYFIEKHVPCIITLSRMNVQNDERYFLTATVLREVNEKFLSYAWYLKYDGENSIKKLKSKIEYFSLLFSQLNRHSLNSVSISHEIDSTLTSVAVNFYNKALKFSSEGNYKDAIEIYGKAIESYPKTEIVKISEAYYNRGINKRYLNDLSGAINDYSEAIKIRPNYYKAFNNRGVVKMLNEDYVGAIADFTKVINSKKLDKNLIASAYGNRGLSKYSNGENGCDDFRRAIELGGEKFKKFLSNCK